MRPFLVCLHYATPAYARETQQMIDDLAPLIGRRLALGVVPNWHGRWPLSAHQGYCEMVAENAEEILLHGYHHHRERGTGPVSWLAERSDEMNGLTLDETKHTIQGGQHVFLEAFGAPARGFLAPAWQQGHVRGRNLKATGINHAVGFFSIESDAGKKIPLATFTWDCGRWAQLGHLGHGIGRCLQSLHDRIPVLAIHPRDLQRGYWSQILQLTSELLNAGREPTTSAALLKAKC